MDWVRDQRYISPPAVWHRRRRLRKSHKGQLSHLQKSEVVKGYGRRFGLQTLIETGTYFGDMVEAVASNFGRIISIELDEDLYRWSQKRLQKHRHVQLLRGNSAVVLPDVLEEVQGPCLFWLDAHYSGGITALADHETPILQELELILERSEEDVLLIDDARCFKGTNDYPTLDGCKKAILARKPEWTVYVRDDIIRAHAEDTES